MKINDTTENIYNEEDFYNYDVLIENIDMFKTKIIHLTL